MPSIDDTLIERGERYGSFKDHAFITQSLKRTMYATPNWATLTNDKKQALEIIADKIARILNGDPEYADNWHDIIGYARLIEVTLETDTG